MSLIKVKGLMILDADGKRICCKYYSKDFSVAEKQVRYFTFSLAFSINDDNDNDDSADRVREEIDKENEAYEYKK